MQLKRNIVLLGGNGFIGSNLCHELENNDFRCIILDKAISSNDSIWCDLSTQNGKIALKKEIIRIANEYKCKELDVVMLAANVGAKLFDSTPYEPFEENYSIDKTTIDAMKSLNAKNGISFNVSYCSTSEVYGSLDDSRTISLMPNITIDPLVPRSLYAQEKLLVETILNYELNKHTWLKSLRIFRLFNVSGKNQLRGVVYEMVKSAMQENIIYYANCCSREITFVQDAIRQMIDVILTRKDGVFDITSKCHVTLKDLAKCIKEALIKIDSKYNGISLVPYDCNDYIKNRGTTKLLSNKDDLDAFTQKLIAYKTIEDISHDI